MTTRILLFLFFLTPSIYAQGNLDVMLVFVEGKVLVDKRPAKDGLLLNAKSVIETFEDASCSLLMGQSTVIRIGSNTKLKIADKLLGSKATEENSEMVLEKGKFRALVAKDAQMKKSLKVRTRSSVMGVRGTDIYIEAPESPTQEPRFLTLEGRAEVKIGEGASERSIQLPENHSISAGGELVTLSGQEIREISSELSRPGSPAPAFSLGTQSQDLQERFDTNVQSSTQEVPAQNTQNATVNFKVDFQ